MKWSSIWRTTETCRQAEGAFDLFVTTFKAKYPKAVECPEKDREVLLRFYDFPAEHWMHLRTACLTMVFELARCAEQHRRHLNGTQLIAEVIRGITFVDSMKEIAA